MQELLSLDCLTISGKTLGAEIDGAEVFNEKVILPVIGHCRGAGATFVLRGNPHPTAA